ncbi:cell division protein FtsZ [Alteriqipengyuania sp. WL0013]|uniref:cell division protein FtsZ n=1 Tax=Alteriqipengyuania sp. WL0013 TaxID=3110773 RepID=UPI002CCE655B|nr:cell division protein FtsZ [Alteriqipengyuania sp. WL0013]MEB3415789.1 cell division protein FtsZ [Alteriqipengyuania sp. WL0013]
MSINIGPPSVEELRPRITVIGVGGAGGNAIANMIDAQIEGVDFVVANTDAQALNNSSAEQRIQLGPEITQGLGAGSRPEVGRAAAEETIEEVERLLDGVNMVFIASGMGGGTGTGAAPVIAEAARKMGVLTVGVVTKPFMFEGARRMRAAEAGIEELQKHVDTLIVIPNQNLFLVAKPDTTFKQAFQLADEVLQQGVRSITDLMVMPGLINLDFADIRSVMQEMGKAMMGTGEGEGDNRALEAAERAIANPLLDGVSMAGAKGVIISIIGGEDMRLLEVDEAANHIRELVDSDANIIWGSAFNPDLDGKIRVSVVATGIEDGAEGTVAPAQYSQRPVDLGASRGPKTPVLPVPSAEEMAEDGEDEDDQFAIGGSDAGDSDDGLSGFSGLSGGYDYDEEEGEDDDDVDDIVDPLAGLRQDDEEDDFSAPRVPSGYDAEPATVEEPATDDAHMNPGEGGFHPPASGADDDEGPLELSGGSSPDDSDDEASSDELLLDATRLAEADEDVQPPAQGGRRRGLVAGSGEAGAESGGGAAGGAGSVGSGGEGSGGGSTLFERMANLSRGGGSGASGSSDDEDDDDDKNDGGGINIPRFLGRQNNQ